MAAITGFRVTQHSQIFHCSLEIEINALRFINYTIPRLCSTYAVATLDVMKAEILLLKEQVKKERDKSMILEQYTRRENIRLLNVK